MIPELKLENEWQIYLTNDTSLHKIIRKILEKTGPARIMFSTFSICDEAICSLKNMKDAGLITELKCVVDFSIRKSRMDLANFLLNISDQVSLCSNHTKIILISNENFNVTLITSANLTENKRYEVGVICTLKSVADVFLEFFKGAMENGVSLNQDKHESDTRRITAN
jgi:hypothetical protein